MGNMSNRALVGNFVFDDLLEEVTKVDAAGAVNVRKRFRQHIQTKLDLKTQAADQRASELIWAVERKIDDAFELWDELRLTRPIERLAPESDTYITWRNPEFRQRIGREPAGEKFFRIFQRVKAADEPETVALACVIMWWAGCDRVYITDGPNDAGVDCLGIICGGSLRSTIVVCQCKKSNQPISHSTVLEEYAKYIALPQAQKFTEYRRNINFDHSLDGAAWLYLFVTNNEFMGQARHIGRSLGILLRSRLQVACVLSEFAEVDALDRCIKRMRGNGWPDLLTNVAEYCEEEFGGSLLRRMVA